MNLISDIRLRWYDESSLLEEEPRKLVELFLKSMGISSDVASDILEVLLIARSKEISLTCKEIKDQIKVLRKKRGVNDASGLTDRNVQIWLKHFKNMKLIERIKSKYMFSKNKRPGVVFSEETKPIIEETLAYIQRILEKLEKTYDIA